jgi:hypothetical protein
LVQLDKKVCCRFVKFLFKNYLSVVGVKPLIKGSS